MGEWTHRYTCDRAYPSYGKPYRIKVTAGLHHLQGNSRPYFSVTAEIYRPQARDCEACGCLHDDVLNMWPTLAPIVALHLSDDTGQPMHATANAWYQLAGYYGGAGERYHAGNSERPIYQDGRYVGYRQPTPDECLQAFADYVRIPLADARTLAESWRCADDWPSSHRWFQAWIVTQAGRWQAEADAACKLLDELSGKGVEV